MIDGTQLQERLVAAGYSPGAIDGRIGPRTFAALFSFMAGRDLRERARELGIGAAAYLPRFQIGRGLRLAHFLGQTAHETMRYVHLREIWGPTAAQRRYEGRRDLGNVEIGDGQRYLGRGLIHLTGRSNYRTAGKRLGIPLERNPELAERADVAVLTACDYWSERGLNVLADRDEFEAITRAINGGTNGLADRLELTARAKAILL